MSSKLTRLLAVIFALALLATACGSGSDGDVVDNATDAAAEETEEAAPEEEEEADRSRTRAKKKATGGAAADEEVDEAVEEAAEEEVEDGGVVTTAIEDLEAEWAEQRAGIVAEIKAAGYGVDGTTLNGPGGWTVDLTECPADWSDNAGVADGTIKIGHTTAQSWRPCCLRQYRCWHGCLL